MQEKLENLSQKKNNIWNMDGPCKNTTVNCSRVSGPRAYWETNVFSRKSVEVYWRFLTICAFKAKILCKNCNLFQTRFFPKFF